MQNNDHIEVTLSPAGAPVRFRQGQTTFAVVAPPEPWYTRHDWWRTAKRAAKGQSLPLDQFTWRVVAVSLGENDADPQTFDLTKTLAGWTLSKPQPHEARLSA